MEIDSIISVIDEIHKKANEALEAKDIKFYMDHFDNGLKYTNATAVSIDKKQLAIDLEKYFKGVKEYTTSYYRIKSTFEEDIFTEKIARKSIVIKPNLLVFSKKQTIQTEELYQWRNINREWKVIEIEVVLEEKY